MKNIFVYKNIHIIVEPVMLIMIATVLSGCGEEGSGKRIRFLYIHNSFF